MKNWALKELMTNHFFSLLSDELFSSAVFHWFSQSKYYETKQEVSSYGGSVEDTL